MRKSIGAAMTAVTLVATGSAPAQTYPDKPIRMVVNYPPGGSSDFTGRILSVRMPESLGQSFVVDNRGGAAGNIGSEIVTRSAPDGYTVLITPESAITINQFVYPRLAFDPVRDLVPITQVIKYPNVVVLHPTVKIGSIQELAQFAKGNPGKLRYSHPGVGTGQQLSVELFKLTLGVDIISVPYKGGGPAMVSLVGNETQLSFATPPSAMPHVKAGRLKAIAVTSGQRSPSLPDLPTVAESGVPGYDVIGWVGMFAPAKTPAPFLKRLNEEIAKVIRVQEVKDLVAGAGSETSGLALEAYGAQIRQEADTWAKVVKRSGIKIE